MIKSKLTIATLLLAASVFLSGCSTMNDLSNQEYGVTLLPETSTGLPNAYLEWEAVAKTLPVASELPDTSSLEARLRQSNIGYQVERGDYLLLRLEPKILFATGSYRLTGHQKTQLAQLTQILSDQRSVDIIVEGHTDKEGSELYNEALSQSRATAVADYFNSMGVAKSHLFARGFGDVMPICSNSSTQGRACNRRVEISIVVHE